MHARKFFTLLMMVTFPLTLGCAAAREGSSMPILVRTIGLPGVGGPVDRNGIIGRIDHMAYDPATRRLFVAAFANGSLEVINLDKGERVKSVGGLKKPQGVAIVPTTGQVIVACADDNSARAFDTRSLEQKAVAEAGDDADNVRYDTKKDRIFVGSGSLTSGKVTEFEPRGLVKIGETQIASHAESFQLDSENTRLFVNLPGDKMSIKDGNVAVLDLDAGKVLAIWPLRQRARNFPMAIDVAGKRLFIACRKPAVLMILDSTTGEVLGEAPCAPDSDDLFYDAEYGHVIVIGGGRRIMDGVAKDEDGALNVFKTSHGKRSRGALTRIASVPLPPHARTGLYVPSRHAVYVAVPEQPGHDAELREYSLGGR